MKITLFDLQAPLCKEWEHFFEREIRLGYIDVRNVSLDYIANGIFVDSSKGDAIKCIVSPANSFGFMDGGIDKPIRELFVSNIELAVQQKIHNLGGELLVGEVISTVGTIKHRDNTTEKCILLSAPTMRVPCNISMTDNVYNAFFAILRWYKFASCDNPDISLFCPGLGTATGCMTATECAYQMKMAWDNIHAGFPKDWTEAVVRANALGKI